jgi:hypothetical protein
MPNPLIVQLSINTIEDDKNAIRRMFPVLFWVGILFMVGGVFVYLLTSYHITNFDGIAIIGFGFNMIAFAFSNQQILHNDTYRKEMREIIRKIEENLTLHLQKPSYPVSLRSYDRFATTLYFAVGFAILGLVTSFCSMTLLNNTPYWVELMTIGFGLLMIATVFEQRFVDYYESSQIKERLIILKKYSKEVLEDC